MEIDVNKKELHLIINGLQSDLITLKEELRNNIHFKLPIQMPSTPKYKKAIIEKIKSIDNLLKKLIVYEK